MARENSPFVPLATLLDFILASKKTHTAIDVQNFTEKILESKECEDYLKRVVANGIGNIRGSRSNWFCRSEIHFLHQFLTCAVTLRAKIDNGVLGKSTF